MLLLLLDLLHELLVLERAMVQRLLEVFPVNVQKCLLLVKLLVLKLLKFPAKTCSKKDKIVSLERLVLQERNQGILILLLPVVHQRSELEHRKLVLSLLSHCVIILDFSFYDVLAFFKHFNLSVKLVHFVFILKDILLVDISEFEFKVLRAQGKAQKCVIQKVFIKHVVPWVHLCRANRLGKVFIEFEVAGPMNLFELLVLQVVPWFQDIALIATIMVSCWQQDFEFFAQIVLNFIAISVIEDLYKLFVAYDTIVIELERLDKLNPLGFTLHQSIQLVEDLYFDFREILVVIRVGVFELSGNRSEMASLLEFIRGITLVLNNIFFHVLDGNLLVVFFLFFLSLFFLFLLLRLTIAFFLYLICIFASFIIIFLIRRILEMAVF